MLIHYIIITAVFYVFLAGFFYNLIPMRVEDALARVLAALWPVALPLLMGLYLGSVAREVLWKEK